MARAADRLEMLNMDDVEREIAALEERFLGRDLTARPGEKTIGDFLVESGMVQELAAGLLAEHALRTRDTDPAPPEHEPERYPTLHAIGLTEALDAVERVAAWAQRGKHPGGEWSTQTVSHQLAKMLGHVARGMKGEAADEDTGEHPYAHVAARALMLVGLVLREAEVVPNPPERCAIAREVTGT